MDDELKFSGLSIEEQRNTGGGRLVTYFGVPAGNENLAITDILSCLAKGFVVKLSNDLDEGLEGLTMLRMTPSGFEMMIGGHGWSSKWKQTDEAEIVKIVKDLAPLNRGGHSNAQGSLSKPI